tara:strand:+ start:1260 stop:2438 length:1179 start_codon:yes stop_codon:yes gene_type:complete
MGLIKQSAYNYYSGNDLGGYQFISLKHIISNFMIAYVGEGKIIPKVKRTDILFHAQRAIQELSYDTFKSSKSQEITIPPSLTMPLPQDYVNYVKLTWVDSSGIEHIIYPTSKTSNPNSIAQDSNGNYMFNTPNLDEETDPGSPNNLLQFPFTFNLSQGLTVGQTTITVSPHILGIDPTTSFYENLADTNPFVVGMEIVSPYFPTGTTISSITEATSSANATITLSHASTNTAIVTTATMTVLDNSDTWSSYSSGTPSENQDDYQDDSYWPNMGDRRGLDPVHAQSNGSYYIDEIGGKIHFSSNINGKTVILKYISDGLGTDEEMIVHKFAEEAMYKSIAYAVLSTTIAGQPLAPSFQQQKSVAIRTAKLRLSNLKIEELTQIMRGKSKFIKH